MMRKPSRAGMGTHDRDQRPDDPERSGTGSRSWRTTGPGWHRARPAGRASRRPAWPCWRRTRRRTSTTMRPTRPPDPGRTAGPTMAAMPSEPMRMSSSWVVARTLGATNEPTNEPATDAGDGHAEIPVGGARSLRTENARRKARKPDDAPHQPHGRGRQPDQRCCAAPPSPPRRPVRRRWPRWAAAGRRWPAALKTMAARPSVQVGPPMSSASPPGMPATTPARPVRIDSLALASTSSVSVLDRGRHHRALGHLIALAQHQHGEGLGEEQQAVEVADHHHRHDHAQRRRGDDHPATATPGPVDGGADEGCHDRERRHGQDQVEAPPGAGPRRPAR